MKKQEHKSRRVKTDTKRKKLQNYKNHTNIYQDYNDRGLDPEKKVRPGPASSKKVDVNQREVVSTQHHDRDQEKFLSPKSEALNWFLA